MSTTTSSCAPKTQADSAHTPYGLVGSVQQIPRSAGDVEMGDIGSPVPAASHSASHAADAPAAAATAVNPEAPHLTIAYHNVSASVQVSPADSRVKTIFTPLVELSKILTGSAATTTFWRVHEASGVIRPGTMTLIIAPPGHGKSSLLRLLADRLKPDHNDNNKGGCGAGSAVKDVGVRYNGLTKAQAAAEGCSVRRMCHLVEQVDEHLPLLTVRETLDFAHECTSMVRDPARVDSVIRMLGLTECQNTILGDALTRGVSGGQKRRVTVGEMLVGDARAVFLDEYTNGLDTATSEDITRGLRKWAHKSNGSVVTTAQQPTPGLYAEYDDIIIMSNADVIYHGPREDVVPFFASMGFNCPDDVDVCDFIIDCVSQPRVALQRLQHNERSDAKAAKAAGAPAPDYSGVRRSTKGELALAATPCVTAAQMLTHYHASPFYLRILSDLKPHFPDVELLTAAPAPDAVTVQPLLPGEHAKRVYSVAYVQSVTSLLAMVFFREVRVLRRSNMLVIPRFLQDILLGLIIGSFFYMVPEDSFFLRIAALLVLTAQCGLSNMAALPSAVDDSRIIFRQAAAGMYPPWAYVVAASLMSLPILIVECILMGLPVYFMSDCVSEASAFLTFFAILLVQSLNVSVFYRLISSGAADEPAAHSITGPITCIAFVLGGFFVSTSSMPVWMRWLMWISPFSWSLRALANNEFLSSRYHALADDGERLGHVYLDSLDMKIGVEWIGYAVLYIMGLSFVFMAIHSWVLRRPYFESSIGTRRVDEAEVLETEEEKAAEDAIQAHDAEVEDDVANGLATHPSFSVGEVSRISAATDVSGAVDSKVLRTLREALPFAPMWLSFSDIHYTVRVPGPDGGLVDRPLLRGVNGFAEPGKLTALMGASGAGKTTLLDVLAGRKNTGIVEGKILFNGRAPSPADVAYHTGYVEQFDSLFPYDTVHETLLFAARLRLPASVSEETKAAIVEEIMDILELTPIRDYIIGNARIVGLSPSQLKRVNIGCELVANPAILFLDEPTTGLDSRAAQTVVRVVRRIARSGRSVICTIHQPSAELFYLFDRLVLLASGGHQLFFGSLGIRCKHFIPFIEATEGVSKCPPRYNPASWMLEEMGVGQASAVHAAANGVRLGRYDDVKAITERFKKTWLASRQHRATSDLLHRLEAIGAEAGLAASASTAAKDVEPEPALESAGLHFATPAPPTIVGVDLHSAAAHMAGVPSRAHSYAISVAQSSVVAAMPSADSAVAKKESPSLLYAYLRVQKRSTVGYFRNPPVLFVRTSVILGLSIIFGLIYFDLTPRVQANAISLVGVIGISTAFGALNHGGSAQPSMVNNRAVLYREIASDMYKPWMWSLAGFITEGFYSIFTTFAVQIPTYFLVGLDSDAAVFWRHYFIVYLLVMCYIAMASFLSSAAPDNTVAGIYQTIYFGIFNIFSGISVPLPRVPRGWLWFFRIIPTSHTTETLVMNQIRNCSPLPLCGPMIETVEGTATRIQHLPEFLSSYFGYSMSDGYGNTVGWLFLFIVVVQTLAFLSITAFNWSKR